MLPEEINLKILRILADQPDISQRGLADELGVSLGKVNYCLRALLQKSWLKMNNFRKSSNKIAYAYVLTPEGLEARARLTVEFLSIKKAEYESIRREISRLESEMLKQKNPKSNLPAR